MLDAVLTGIKLKTGKHVNKDTGEVKLYTDLYTPEGNLARVYGYDCNSVPDFTKVCCQVSIMTFNDGRQYLKFIKEVK